MDYDEALGEYLDTYEADEIFNNYLIAIRKAFIAGYKAANGEMQLDQNVPLELNQGKREWKHQD